MEIVEAERRAAAPPPAAPAGRAARGACGGGRPRPGRGALGQRRQHARQRLRVGEPEPRPPALADLGEPAVERLGPQRVRAGRPRTPTRAPRAPCTPLRLAAQVGEQPRLADARLALEHHDAARRRRAAPSSAARDRLALARTSDQRSGIHAADSPSRGPVRWIHRCRAPTARGTLRPMQTDPIHPAVRVGHVHLRVADLDRSIAFYARRARPRRDRRRPRGRPRRRVPRGRRLPPPHRPQHLGERRRLAAAPGPHRPLPRRVPLPRPPRARPRRPAAARPRRRDRPRHRPRRHRLRLPRRPRRQRRRALLRPPAPRLVRRRGPPVLKADRFDFRDLLPTPDAG